MKLTNAVSYICAQPAAAEPTEPYVMNVRCIIYKTRKHPDLYLFVRQQDDLTPVPEALLAHFGKPEKVTTLTLTATRKLAQANAADVLAALAARGYYLQLPAQRGGEMAAIAARNAKLPHP